jgi:NADPH:quinone reductase-like Zn-dependent oxidoreductase
MNPSPQDEAPNPIGTSMMAWRVHEFGPPEVMRFERVPQPAPGPGEVLVKVDAAGVGPWDGWIRAGRSALPQPLPLTLGSDLSGEVQSVGMGVSDLCAGDRVYGVTNPRFIGAYAEYALASAGIRSIATAATDEIAFVRDLGADTVVDFRTQRFEDAAQNVDAVLDLVGGETQRRSFQVLRRGGRLISAVSTPDLELAKSDGVEATFFLVKVAGQYLTEIADLIDSGKLRTRVGKVLRLADAREAHFILEGRRRPAPKGKIVLSVAEV